MHSEVIITIVK